MQHALLFFFSLCCSFCMAQTNLVPNPSFEEHTGCYTLDDDCNDWFTFKQTPDYIHGCNFPAYNNGAGFQLPRTGEAYAGFINYVVNHPSPNPSIREHFGVKLTEPLVIGVRYYVSFYVSAGYTNTSFNIACNNIGALFTTYIYYSLMGEIPNQNFAHVNETAIVTDTVGWVKISGSFIADSTYTYLIIGSFYDDVYTDTLNFPFLFPNSQRNAYYFVDDVCVSTDAALCSVDTVDYCSFVLPSAFTPNGDHLNDEYRLVHNCKNIESFIMRVYNRWGKLVFATEDYNNGWDGKNKDEPQPDGVYWVFVEVVADGKLTNKSASVSLIR